MSLIFTSGLKVIQLRRENLKRQNYTSNIMERKMRNELRSSILTSCLVLGQKGQLSYNQDNEHKAEK